MNPEMTGLSSEAQGLYGLRVPFLQYLPGDPAGRSKAQATLERLKSRSVIDFMNEMRRQSATGATGLGSITEKELELLGSGASILGKTNISDADAAAELKRIYDLANRFGGDAPAESQDAGGRVQVIAPDGKRGTIPAAQLQDALARGYKQAQ
jgi:sugar phosphate isomerase/epimerase